MREAAVDALVDIGGSESAWALAIALEDEDASVREEAVYALGILGGELATGILERALADEVPFVAEAAARLLTRLTPEP